MISIFVVQRSLDPEDLQRLIYAIHSFGSLSPEYLWDNTLRSFHPRNGKFTPHMERQGTGLKGRWWLIVLLFMVKKCYPKMWSSPCWSFCVEGTGSSRCRIGFLWAPLFCLKTEIQRNPVPQEPHQPVEISPMCRPTLLRTDPRPLLLPESLFVCITTPLLTPSHL